CIDSNNRSAKDLRVNGADGNEARVKVPTPDYGKNEHMAIDPIASHDTSDKDSLYNKVENLAKAAEPRIVQVMACYTCE
ncbi:metalloprotease TldD, partial [Neisseria sp. P0009.S005]